MSSGIKWDENLPWTDPKNDEPHRGQDPEPIRYVLGKPVAAPPDTVWNYNGGGTDLLGSIIERVSGKPFERYCARGIVSAAGDRRWEIYQNGKVSPAAGLRLRPRDAAKIGQLVLNGRHLERAANRPRNMGRAINSAALSSNRVFRRSVLLWLSVVAWPHAFRNPGSHLDSRDGSRRAAHLHRSRS